MTKLELDEVSVSFGAFNAVKSVHLAIEGGEFISLLGPSGCGKTTTLRMIAGFLQPGAGQIRVDGKVMSSAHGMVPPEMRGMSMMFQSYAIWPNMTVAENVAFGLKLRKLPRAEVAGRTFDMLDKVRLRHLADRYPAELSGGQQQRVALARAIVIRPNVFLLDEPLSNLDANLREEMRLEIRRLHDVFGMTTVYVTHDQTEAMSTSDRIVVMNSGSVEQIAPPYEIFNRPATRFVAEFIGRTNILKAGPDGNANAILGPRIVYANGISRDISFAQGCDLSIRPKNIVILGPDSAPSAGQIVIDGRIVSRSYLGESWEYIVQSGANDDDVLKVSALPNVDHPVGSAVKLGINAEDVVFLDSTGPSLCA